MLYFAFGSNMSARQMTARCPGARSAGRAVLNGWRFIMSARGSANIVQEPGASVHGVLWRCEPHHLAALDRWEGVSWRNYHRRRVQVCCADGRHCSAVSYISLRNYRGQARASYLFSAVLPGARDFQLPSPYHDELAAWAPRRPINAASGRYAPRYVGRRR